MRASSRERPRHHLHQPRVRVGDHHPRGALRGCRPASCAARRSSARRRCSSTTTRATTVRVFDSGADQQLVVFFFFFFCPLLGSLRIAPAHTGTGAGRGSPLPATGQPSPGPRRALGPAPHSPDVADRTACGSTADRTGPCLAHLRRRRQYRHGGTRPHVRTLTPPDRRTPRPPDHITHTHRLAPQPRNRRSLLAPAPTARHSTGQRASNALTTVRGRQVRPSAGHRPGGTASSARPYHRYTGADCTRCSHP